MLEQFKDALRSWVGPAPGENQNQNISLGGIALEYSYEDLKNGTQDFNEGRRLGAGAAGAVYKGTLRGGTEVAVKVLKNNCDLAGFEDEVRVLSRFRHPNLVTLLGWGQHENDRYLVYELLPGGDVEKKLQKSKKGSDPFPWQQRLNIALDSACGLSYMLNSQPKAFHRDIKPPNILLDANGTAKMADFGLAGTIKQDGKRHLTVEHISGTPGYACPQYIESGRVSEQSEVYSFGTVMLELLMNEHPALCGPSGNIIYPLMTVVQPAAPGAYERVMSRLDRTAAWPETLVGDVVKLSLHCVGHPDRRPMFEHIVQELRSHVQAASQVTLPTPVRSRSSHSAGEPSPAHHMASQAQGGYAGGQPLPPPPPQANVAVHASMPPKAKAASPAPPPPPAPQRSAGRKSSETYSPPKLGADSELAEIVLECVHADGLELAMLPQKQRAIALRVQQGKNGCVSVGRQQQIEFFERLVPRKDRLTAISRNHFEIMWDESCAVRVKKVSGNPLLLDNRPLANNEPALVQDGASILFSSVSEDVRFLELRVVFRNCSTVRSEGPHPAIQSPPASPQHASKAAAVPPKAAVPGPLPKAAGIWQPDTVALLECTSAKGIDVSSLPMADRVIELSFQSSVDIGKQKQPSFFNRLLEAEPTWLSFISRAHCKVQLSRQPLSSCGAVALTIENLSVNVVLVSDRKVSKGHSECIQEGGTFAFVAAPAGSSETKFLEFVLRSV